MRQRANASEWGGEHECVSEHAGVLRQLPLTGVRQPLSRPGSLLGAQVIGGQFGPKERWRAAAATPPANGRRSAGPARSTFQPARGIVASRDRPLSDRPLFAAPASPLQTRGYATGFAASTVEPIQSWASGEVAKPQQPRDDVTLGQRSNSARSLLRRRSSAGFLLGRPGSAGRPATSPLPPPAEGGSSSRLAPPLPIAARREDGTSGGNGAPSPPPLTSTLPPSVAVRGEAVDCVVIHVCDEAHNVRKDFYCELPLLLAHMRYFESYFSNVSCVDELDISVHCDINVFEWLILYVHSLGGGSAAPQLEVSNCVSILISSDFLQMGQLVSDCEAFVVAHASQIAQQPIDLSCISDATISRMADKFTPSMLQALVDRKGKLAPRLYESALFRLVDGPASALRRCVHCARLFTAEQGGWEVCGRVQPIVDRYGSLSANHEPDEAWDRREWVSSLREQPAGLGAMEAFWRVWAQLQLLECQACGSAFVAAELAHCSFHPRLEVPDRPGGPAMHPCCAAAALSLDVLGGRRQGCCMREHVPRGFSEGAAQGEDTADGGDEDSAEAIARLLFAVRTFACTPAPTTPRLAKVLEAGGAGARLSRALRAGSGLEWARQPSARAQAGEGVEAGGAGGASGRARSGLGPAQRVPAGAPRPRAATPAGRTPPHGRRRASEERPRLLRGGGMRGGGGGDSEGEVLSSSSESGSESSYSSDSDAPPAAGPRRSAVGARGRAVAGGQRARAKRRPATVAAQRELAMSPRRAREFKLDALRVEETRRIERLLRALDLERAVPVGEGVPQGDGDRVAQTPSRAVSRGASSLAWVKDDAYLLAPKPTFLRPSAIMHVSRGSNSTGGVVLARPGTSRTRQPAT
ncbi:hypothetical protein T492DRAFT_1145993 [Pavlovales sp. CCMP2436]|nr:hypothetical protein T492DRAFT_1145993 [Pavlovales sp. CCMP2436]